MRLASGPFFFCASAGRFDVFVAHFSNGSGFTTICVTGHTLRSSTHLVWGIGTLLQDYNRLPEYLMIQH